MNFTLVGFRTIIVGLFGVIGVPALTYLSGVDWTALGVSPVVATVISSAIFMALRFKTATPVFKPTAVPAVAAMSDAELHAAGVVKMLTEPNTVGEALAALSPGKAVQVIGNPSPQTGIGRRAS